MELALIGLGKMGLNMATRLARGGHRVVGYARTKESVEAAIAERGRFLVALSGGSTPMKLYERLASEAPALSAAEGIDWSRAHFFWGDERCVPVAQNRKFVKRP
ncbi:MAG: 6-phosphogluconolactonase [Methylococcales bacterium]|nr:6-phosphogluconolactonase [Methylococcales bacterium]